MTYVIGFLTILVARFLNVLVMVVLLNFCRSKNKIKFGHAFLLWFSGFRGALAFTMGIIASEELGILGESFLSLTIWFTCLSVPIDALASSFFRFSFSALVYQLS